MGIFDFFKSKKLTSELEFKKIEFVEVNNLISKEKQKIVNDEKETINIIKDNISNLNLELEAEILELNKVDLNNRKVEERLKIIVLENTKVFASYLEKLKEKLKNIQNSKFLELIKEINATLQEHKKKSFMSKEKASIYIGKELAAVEKTMNSFYRNMDEVVANNKKLIETSLITEKSESLYKEIEEIKEIIKKIQAQSDNINEDISELKKQKDSIKKKIIQIKESKEYIQKLKRHQEFETQKKELKEEFSTLRNLINLKELAKIHHSSPKNMKIIKECSDNIQDTFEKDRGKSILELIIKDKERVTNKVNEILEKEKKIAEFIPEKDDIQESQREVENIECRIKELEVEKTAFENKISDSQDKIKNLKVQLAQEIKKIGFELE